MYWWILILHQHDLLFYLMVNFWIMIIQARWMFPNRAVRLSVCLLVNIFFFQNHRQKRIIPSWLITPQIEFQHCKYVRHWKQFLISELKWKYGSQFGYIKCNSLKFHLMQILKTIFSVENICSVEILFAV